MSDDLFTALALVIVIEGMLYALFPGFAKRMANEVLGMPESALRSVGLVAVAAGVFFVWLLRG